MSIDQREGEMNGTDFTPLLVELATGVWRLNGKLTANGSDEGESAKLLRSLSRQVSSMSDALDEAGIDIQDHTGEPFDAGQSLDVVAYATNAAMSRETVVETITPTVYVEGRIAQRGQIVVAGPEPERAAVDEDAEPTEPTHDDEGRS
jgi:hypothetical protein